jgi:filamentous hemagglutinin family protein
VRIDSVIRLLASVSSVALICAITSSALANPLDGTVVSGDVTITSPNPTTLEVNQTSDRAIVDWRRFDIGIGETTIFNQPTIDAWILNRVLGTDAPSEILGNLQANGNVVVVNPDGIHFGAGSRVDVNRLIATTADIENDAFMSGTMAFTKPGNPSASIVNEGAITAADYGLASLVAPGVRNSGIITARLGSINLASGNTFTIDPYGDGLVKLAIDDEIASEVFDAATGETVADMVKNEGTLKADGGTVAMKAVTARKAVNSVVNNTGVIEANSVGMRGGKIILGGQTAARKTVARAPLQRVRVSGTVRATAIFPDVVPIPTPAPRGTIEITGEAIEVANANIDASGTFGGGTVLIGGDYLGGTASDEMMAEYGIAREATAIPTASFVSLDEMTTLNAAAIEMGNGGKVVVWSDLGTYTAADINARGGAIAGNGGFIETSGKYLDVRKAADASAYHGNAGTWLLDPSNFHLKAGLAGNWSNYRDVIFTNIDVNGTHFDTVEGTVYVSHHLRADSYLDTNLIESALNSGNNVRITTRGSTGAGLGNIYVESDIRRTSGSGTRFLQLDAARDIIFSSGVNVVSSSGLMHIFLTALDGKIVGNDVGRIDAHGGVFKMDAGKGVTFKSRGNMPAIFGLEINSVPVRGTGRTDIDIAFNDDFIKFSYRSGVANLLTNGIRLGSNTSNFFELLLHNLDLAFGDRSLVSAGTGWRYRVDPNKGFGAAIGNALNGIAEIVSTGAVTISPTPNDVAGISPTLEIDATNTDDCPGNLTCIPTGPSGAAKIDAYLHPVVPPMLILPTYQVPTVGPAFPKPKAEFLINLKLDDFSVKRGGFGNWFDTDDNLSANKLIEYSNPFIRASAAAYDPYVANGKTIIDWLQLGVDPDSYKAMSALGFSATLFLDGDHPILAFRGTNDPISGFFSDVLGVWSSTNFPNLVGDTNNEPQYAFGLALAQSLLTKYPDLILTGHSLGGGIAAYSGASLSIPAVTFNPAGVDTNLSSYSEANVLNFVVRGDKTAFGGEILGKTIILEKNSVKNSGSGISFWHSMDRFADISEMAKSGRLQFNAIDTRENSIFGSVQ